MFVPFQGGGQDYSREIKLEYFFNSYMLGLIDCDSYMLNLYFYFALFNLRVGLFIIFCEYGKPCT